MLSSLVFMHIKIDLGSTICEILKKSLPIIISFFNELIENVKKNSENFETNKTEFEDSIRKFDRFFSSSLLGNIVTMVTAMREYRSSDKDTIGKFNFEISQIFDLLVVLVNQYGKILHLFEECNSEENMETKPTYKTVSFKKDEIVKIDLLDSPDIVHKKVIISVNVEESS